MLKELVDKQVVGAPDHYYTNIAEKGTCSDICKFNTSCVMAWHDKDKSYCYIFDSEAGRAVSGSAGDTVYKKVQETSSGV